MGEPVTMEQLDLAYNVLIGARDTLRQQTHQLCVAGRQVDRKLETIEYQRKHLAANQDRMHTDPDLPCA